MGFNAQSVLVLIQQGMSPVCATCEHFWSARYSQQPGCGHSECGGPIVGKDFPDYKGELPDLERWCFACAGRSDYAIRVPRGTRMVGVCKEHVRLLQDLLPTKPVDGKLILTPGNGEFVTIEQVREPTKPTLVQCLIMDTIGWSKT